jgi:hypothetical protein
MRAKMFYYIRIFSLINLIMEAEKKRRGRRPKSEKPVVDQPSVKEDKKKGRKPKYVYNSFESNVQHNNASNLSDDENIIVKLNIQSNILDGDIVVGGEVNDIFDSQPCAYNSREYSNVQSIGNAAPVSSLSIPEMDQTSQQSNDMNADSDLRVLELLKDFEEKNKNNEWPSNTSIACYWCCHKFNNSPFGIPLNYKNDKFDVFGCFCSLECATAYNFKNNDNVDEMWERYNLINLMCRKMNYGNYVKPAPAILSLKMFGGYLEIDKFREYFKTDKVINVNFPPMTSITQQLEEINENDLNNEYKFIPIDNDRINKYKEKIFFKRSKPLINNTNSLENTMKLTYM